MSHWVCDDCLEKEPHASVFTVGDMGLGEPCEACRKPQARRPGNYQGRHLVDTITWESILSKVRIVASDEDRRAIEAAPLGHVLLDTTKYPDLRQTLETPTARIAALKRFNGYPVPFFVDYLDDGTPEFRAMDSKKFVRCIRESLCWVCGQKIEETDRAFTIGPMCIINRTTAEPPSHLECAQWSVRNCPFLSNPDMTRRDAGNGRGADDLASPAGHMIMRNPKVTCLWSTRMFKLFKDSNGGILINIGPPTAWEWWSCGRRAKRVEVEDSIKTGLPNLFALCANKRETDELMRRAEEAEKFFPVLTA